SAHLNWPPRAQGYPFCAILTRDKIKTPATAATPKTPNILRKSFWSSAILIRSSTQRLTNSAPKTTAITATSSRNCFIQNRLSRGLLPRRRYDRAYRSALFWQRLGPRLQSVNYFRHTRAWLVAKDLVFVLGHKSPREAHLTTHSLSLRTMDSGASASISTRPSRY